MLKKISKLFLGLMVCAGSACVTPTHASSASPVIITHIQAASPAGAKDEMVAIYNNSQSTVDVTNWCLKNKSNVKFACLTPPEVSLAYDLSPGYFAVFASESYIENNHLQPEGVSVMYQVTNQSSGSIVNGGDTISLLDAQGAAVNSYTWSTAIPAGRSAVRQQSVAHPAIYETVDPLLSWANVFTPVAPENGVTIRELDIDDSEVPEDPDGPTDPVDPSDTQNPPEQALQHPVITEILPNPIGVDTGNEFIELYNPNPDATVSLSQYKLKVGKELEKSYAFPVGLVLLPLEYRAFPNTEIKFTLLNTTSSVAIEQEGQVVGDVVTYLSPKEGQSYSLVDGVWVYTLPTPNDENSLGASAPSAVDFNQVSTTTILKPCAANQYRSPETNRCRLIASASTSPAPCAANQYRNAATNRCRNIAATTTPAACKVGQERNPDTKRCRNIQKMTTAEHSIKGVATESSATGVSWYLWLGIAGIIALIVGYGVWEWREELLKIWTVARQKFARSKN